MVTTHTRRVMFIKKILLHAFLLFSLSSIRVHAQFLPKDGDTLNYRLIGFAFPSMEKATEYQIEVSEYSFQPNGEQVVNKIFEKRYGTNRVIETVPEFGKSYKWRVLYKKKNKTINTTPYYYFSTAKNPFSSPAITRLNIIDAATEHKDLLVFFDNTRTLYNIKGEPLWFLPPIEGVTNDNINSIRDIKLTPFGTITFVTYSNVFEIDYDGNVLWTGPNDGKVSGDTSEYYHHEFTRLANGHYMAIGSKLEMHKVPSGISEQEYRGRQVQRQSGARLTKISCGTLIEYDEAGKVTWSWNSCDHMTDADFFTPIAGGRIRPSTHMNAFFMDTVHNVFYTSYRDIDRVIKAEYPSGRVLQHYGEDYTKDGRIKGDGMFYAQHSCRISAKGNLYLFNNNHLIRERPTDSNQNRISTIAVFKEPQSSSGQLEKIWEFGCDIDTHAKAFSPGGGSVYELENGDFLVCMGASNRNFIVSRDKKVLWNLTVELNQQNEMWVPCAGYRVSPVTPQQLKQLIWASSKK